MSAYSERLLFQFKSLSIVLIVLVNHGSSLTKLVNSTLATSQINSGPGISSAETNKKPFNIFFHQQLNTSGFSNILTEDKPVTTLNATQGLNNPLLSSNDANFEQFNHDSERNNNSKPLFVNHTAQTHNDNEEPLVDLALTLLNELNEQQEWVNHLDHELRYECPTGHFISGFMFNQNTLLQFSGLKIEIENQVHTVI